MNFRLNLRARFWLAMLSIVAVLCLAFSITVHEFIELLEREMVNRTLVREMQEFTADFARHPEHAPPAEAGLTGFIVRTADDGRRLPPRIGQLGVGLHWHVEVNERQYAVAVEDSGASRLYLMLDMEPVDSLEDSVLTTAAIAGLLALALSAVLAIGLSRAVMRPVTELAMAVTALDPRRRELRLHQRFADREVSSIAAAFDDYIGRLAGVLEREQAFTEDASHELRTPLAIIASAAQLLAEESQLSTLGQERIVRIRRACTQMEALIETLLFLAREDSRTPAQSCALDEIVREAVDAAMIVAAEKAVAIDAELQAVSVTAPPGMAACVVNNLLLNAISFTPRGLIEVKLTPAELMVRDTGVGIAPSDLSRIFERRYRGSTSRGLGLGLYLVSRICEHLHWTISADSEEGVGTTFRIRLQSAATTGQPEGAPT
ncbi:MAG: HAMP domain-containing histidine kinase [Gammaproteobacteria bacterium]|nr:HAMP domain-containing histidine kinase [Gammaproteobacteria bacterium]